MQFPSLLLALAATPAAAAPAPTTTALPLDATIRCLRDSLGGMGRLVTINTAGGALLDLAFDSVGRDGRVAQQRVTFTIDDLGGERQVKAAAGDPADAPLAAQMLQQANRGCLSPTN